MDLGPTGSPRWAAFLRRLSIERALLVLIASLLLTALATFLSLRVLQERQSARVELAIDHDLSRLESRVSAYLALLRATRSFVEAEGADLSARRFAVFVAGLRIAGDYPGIQGIGWSPLVDRASWRFEIRYLEPRDERNMAAIGFDMHSEPIRAAAMDRARDLAAPAMSGSVVLRQEIHPNRSRGFLIYVPVYLPGPTPASLDERRQQLAGFVYAPFRAVDFFAGVFQRDVVALRSIRVAGQDDAADGVLVGEVVTGAGDVVERQVEFAGQRWILQFEPLPGSLQTLERIRPAAVLLLGLVISGLLFALVRAQAAERREAEQRSAEMGQQVHSAELLVGIVSHDLRNPLNVIKLNATLLERAPMGAEFARCVRRIQASSDMSLRLIRDLLDFTRARFTGGIHVVRTPGDVIPIVQQSVDEIKVAHPDRPIVMAVQGSGWGTWDADRIAQVVSNLLNNAIVYGSASAPITVSVQAESERVVLRVHNHGEAIRPELQAVLFQPLQQGAPGQGAEGRNIGLGLYIVQQIVRAHGGSVECRSAPAEGTTFTVTLPRSAG